MQGSVQFLEDLAMVTHGSVKFLARSQPLVGLSLWHWQCTAWFCFSFLQFQPWRCKFFAKPQFLVGMSLRHRLCSACCCKVTCNYSHSDVWFCIVPFIHSLWSDCLKDTGSARKAAYQWLSHRLFQTSIWGIWCDIQCGVYTTCKQYTRHMMSLLITFWCLVTKHLFCLFYFQMIEQLRLQRIVIMNWW